MTAMTDAEKWKARAREIRISLPAAMTVVDAKQADELLAAALAEAAAEENERCAMIAEENDGDPFSLPNQVANAIRAREQKP